jgi:predicted acylesterase/phospholipase RssA
LLVDGSLMDNLPVAAMAAAGEGPVLAIDIKQESERHGRGNGVPSRPPGLIDTLNRVIWLASANTSVQAALYADRVIEVRVGAVGLTEFHQIDTAVQCGAAAARKALDAYGPGLELSNGTSTELKS